MDLYNNYLDKLSKIAPKINIKNAVNFRLFRICSVLIRIGSPELRVWDRCFLHEIKNMGRYVTTTYRLHKLHVYVLGGYVSTTYP